MAGKKSKNSKKKELDVVRFAYDILSFTLRVGGFPKEKIICEERKPNSYRNSEYVFRISAIVMSAALHYRDQWKTMFESRLKNSGLGTIEEIEKYLSSLLSITIEYRKAEETGSASPKVHLALSVYSEIILFLNYKSMEFPFEQYLHSWSHLFMEKIAGKQNAGEILYDLFYLLDDFTDFVSWITNYMQNIASPYGCRDDISAVYRERVKIRREKKHDKDFRLAESLAQLVDQRNKAKESAPILQADFESSTILPGDRESPEPPIIPESNAVGRRKGPRRARARSTNVLENRFVELPKALRLGSETTTSLPGDRQSPKPQPSHETGAGGGRKVSKKTRTRSAGASELRSSDLRTILKPGFETMKTVLPGDRKSPEPSLNPESGDDGEKKTSRVQFRSTGAMEYGTGKPRNILRPDSKTPTSLSSDSELHEPQSSHTNGVVPGKKLSRAARVRSTSVSEQLSANLRTILKLGSETMKTVLPGDRKSPEPSLNPESGDDGKKKTSRVQFRSTGAMEYGTGEPRNILLPDSKTPTSLSSDGELHEPQSSHTNGVVPGKKLSRTARARSISVSEQLSANLRTILKLGSETMKTVLPADRESPEPSLNPESGDDGERKTSRVQFRSIGAMEYGESRNILQPDSKTPTSLSSDDELHEPQSRHTSGVVPGKKLSRVERAGSTGVSELRSAELLALSRPGFETMKTDLPADHESPESSLNPESADDGVKKTPRKVQFRSTGEMEYRSEEPQNILRPGYKKPASLSGDRELHEPQSRHTRGVVPGKKLSRAARAGSTGVSEQLSAEWLALSRSGFETMVTVLHGDGESFAPQSTDTVWGK